MKVLGIDSHSRPRPKDHVVEPFMSGEDRAKGSRSLTLGGLGSGRGGTLKLHRGGVALLVLCSMCLAAVAVVSASARYTLVDLGSLGGTRASPTVAYAINEPGIVAGTGLAAVDGGGANHAAVSGRISVKREARQHRH